MLTVFAITTSVFLGGCANMGLSSGQAEMAQYPISDQPSGSIFPGKFVWHDLLTPDAHAAGEFYKELFGWKIEYHDQYAVARNGEKPVAGILQKKAKKDGASAIWVPSVSVTDVDATVTATRKNGGVVLNPAVDMKQRGRAALVTDPQGAYLVLLRAEGGDPADIKAEPGDWLWDEIWTKTPNKTKVYYLTVLGYDEITTDSGYGIFTESGKWRAGMRPIEGKDQPAAMWVPVIRVTDPEQTARKVASLGGVVWISPEDAPRKGETALIADPTGALFLIQKWPSQASKGGE
jgi:predicted enzyme related to lactoylglutathione lyase